MVVLKQQRRMQKQEPRLAQQRERRVQKRVKEQRQKSAKQEDKQKRKEKWMEEVMQKYAQQREPERIQELERRELLITGARKVSKYTGRSSFLQNVEAAPELIDESVPGFVQVPGPASVPEPAQVPGPAEQNGVDHGNLDEQPSYQEKDLDPEPVDQQHSHRNDHDSNNNETSALNAVGIALRDTETRGNALAEQSVQGSSFDETPRSSPELLVLGAPETIAPVEGEITDGTSITTGGDHAIPLQATQAEIIIQESNEDRWSLDLARESEVSEIQQNTGTEASTNDSSSEEEAVQYNPEVNPLFLATDAFGVTKSVAAETFGNSSGNTHCVQTDSETLKATHAETTVPGSSETKSSAHDVLNGMSTISAGEPEIPKAQQETGAEVPVTNLSSEKQAHLDAPKSGISASESIDPTTGKMLQEKSETADHAPVKVNGLQAGQVEPPTPVSSSSSPSVFDMFGSILMTLILTPEVSEVQQNTGTEMSLHGANTKEQQHQDTSEPTKSGAQDVLEVGFLTTDCVQPHLQDRQTTQLSDDDDFCRKLLTSNREPEITESHQNSENKSLLHRSSSGKQVYGKSSRERPVVLDTGKAAEKVEAPFGITYRIQANLLATQSADISLDIDLIFSTHEPTVPGDQKKYCNRDVPPQHKLRKTNTSTDYINRDNTSNLKRNKGNS
ncbi:hypothetical protein B9Z55_023842 [Caenorhabditis nigoni]|uniref:Uncharacterized protein n=1 Tax=Caenorhabditis nigoni TaxID=1611254 RepID=A0A2G5SS38_9PELO|nr:hypothetical protein B9Z55_023842 [Caenorhabditis nigoni]